MDGTELCGRLSRAGVVRGDLVALVVRTGVGLGIATAGESWSLGEADLPATVGPVERSIGPRWVLWSRETALALAASGIHLARAWDLATVHRLLFGGLAGAPGSIWAAVQDLDPGELPAPGPEDLFSSLLGDQDDPEEPVRSDRHLRPDWTGGGWGATPQRLRRWAELGLEAALLQQARLTELAAGPVAVATARSESAAELLCAEMTAEGLPMDRAEAEEILAGFIGERPADAEEEALRRARRDAEVLQHLPPGVRVDLRSTVQVKTLLRRLGLEVADTRAWRLRELEDRHPIVTALLTWRKAERMSTTYGYGWLDEHLGADGRLRGSWSSCDGAAGRMTASAGLHNLPAELRPAVRAEPGHVLVRADLGQIEPRVLAAVSGDEALARASLEGDLYAPVAAELGLDRAGAKVAVLGAMYGQTTGDGALALRRMASAYPVAMAYLDRAYRAGESARDLRTHGGRLIHFRRPAEGAAPAHERRAAAARGRFGRNALVQGAAAELFKLWAVTFRARSRGLGAKIVLCLHDELLVHAPREQGDEVVELLLRCLDEAAARWAPSSRVRFLAEVAVVERWSDAKGATIPPGRSEARAALG